MNPNLFPHHAGSLHPRSGAVSWPLALLACVLVGVVAYLAISDGEENLGTASAASPTQSEPATEAEPAAPTSSESPATPRTPLAASGRIRGRLNFQRGVTLPEEWDVLLTPSQFFESGGAVERRITLSSTRLDFEVTGLKFGTYDVQPIADGMNSLTVPVLLSQENADVYITLLLTPAGTLSGQVAYEGGVPAEGVLVRARRLDLPDAEQAKVQGTFSNEAGQFEFAKLPDGEYELWYGDDLNPISKPKRLVFVAPSMHLPPQDLGKRGGITIQVFDEAGNPLSDVMVSGFGSSGGFIDQFTDSTGSCFVAGLPVGHYSINTEHPGFPPFQKVLDLESADNSVVRFTLAE